jgi:indole-3-glycerol phosphate synthase
LPKKLLSTLLAEAKKIGLDCLVEVHDDMDLKKALTARAGIIGINNRNLKTFKIDLEKGSALARKVPDNRIVVIESGIKKRSDLKKFKDAGANTFLIGELFMRSKNIKKAFEELLYD